MLLSVGNLGPFWPNPMRPKRGQRWQPISPQGQVVPKPQLGPPDPILAPNSIKPQNGHKTLRTHFWPRTTMDHFSAHGHQISSVQSFPSPSGEFLHSSMHPVLKVPGVVHMWYYIPLCTIFAQQLNGDVFRTQFHLSSSRSQNQMPILKEDFLTHQSGNPWRQSEDHSRIPTT
ncbi:hypothetical protein O181_045478 [Austropuccinia psidii MF-1]|uniref:Uncharacterized protein n=1 Tax=Austropuccinia psidii MF-1 TaxID=1389203 RepID=A0A9Q3HHM7_9BASI|nr:hypothetical protein [Austropuccinia psidii MF-1]